MRGADAQDPMARPSKRQITLINQLFIYILEVGRISRSGFPWAADSDRLVALNDGGEDRDGQQAETETSQKSEAPT
jgi:hypothetical protein